MHAYVYARLSSQSEPNRGECRRSENKPNAQLGQLRLFLPCGQYPEIGGPRVSQKDLEEE
jgi:hypothetical protein